MSTLKQLTVDMSIVKEAVAYNTARIAKQDKVIAAMSALQEAMKEQLDIIVKQSIVAAPKVDKSVVKVDKMAAARAAKAAKAATKTTTAPKAQLVTAPPSADIAFRFKKGKYGQYIVVGPDGAVGQSVQIERHSDGVKTVVALGKALWRGDGKAYYQLARTA